MGARAAPGGGTQRDCRRGARYSRKLGSIREGGYREVDGNKGSRDPRKSPWCYGSVLFSNDVLDVSFRSLWGVR